MEKSRFSASPISHYVQYYFMLKMNHIILDKSACCVFLIFPEVSGKKQKEYSNLQVSMYIIILGNEYRYALTSVLTVPCDGGLVTYT